jgi:hypothetical protein
MLYLLKDMAYEIAYFLLRSKIRWSSSISVGILIPVSSKMAAKNVSKESPAYFIQEQLEVVLSRAVYMFVSLFLRV